MNPLGEASGAAEGIRTPDPRITNALLYQLSYRGFIGFLARQTRYCHPNCHRPRARRVERADSTALPVLSTVNLGKRRLHDIGGALISIPAHVAVGSQRDHGAGMSNPPADRQDIDAAGDEP
jgi:hypothetical protein